MAANCALGECHGIDCIKPALFTCGRCKAVHYCSEACNRATWSEHKKVCKRVGEEIPPYRWDPPSTETRALWTVTDMQKGPDQPMNPPEEYEYIQMWWEDREFVLHGKVMVKAPIFPPQFKKIIQKGLKEKRVTWDYLMSDNFMYSCVNSTVPVDMFCIYLETFMLASEVKPRMSGLLEIATEHFWRTKALEGWPEYDVNAARALKRHKIVLPFKYEGHNVDEFRLFTHPEACPCYNCMTRPYQEEKHGERWEMLRLAEAKRGRYMASWTSVKEFEQRQLDAYLWDIDTSEPGKYKKWRYEPDEGKCIQHLTKQEVTEICRMLDVAAKCKRPPTHEELDWIMNMACESRVPVVAVAPKVVPSPSSVPHNVSSGSGDSTTSDDSENVFNAKLPASDDVTASSTAAVDATSDKAVADVSDSDSQATRLDDDQKCESQSKKARHDTGSGDCSSSAVAGDAVSAAVISGVNSIEIVDPDPNYSLAAHRPRRALAQRMVSYVESSSDEEEEDSQATRLDPSDTAGTTGTSGTATTAAVKGKKHFEVEEDEEECSDWDDRDATRLESEDESDDDSATVLEQSSTDSDLTVCDVAEVKKRQAAAATAAAGSKAKIATKKAGDKKPKKKAIASAGSRMIWSPNQDDRLREAVAKYGRDWGKVAELVNCGYNNQQCMIRWMRYVDPNIQHCKEGEWTEAEVNRLKLLVEGHKTDGKGAGINWNVISKELNRGYQDCKNKWDLIRWSSLKKGPFSPEEDAIIVQRVKQWGDRGNGLWTALEEEMGRSSARIRERWKCTLSKRL